MSQKSSVQLGIVGLGNIARQHIDNIISGQVERCELVALCSRSGAEQAATLGLQYFGSYMELIDSGLCDAVLIATPTFNHLEIGRYALNAGLHVMMEKPIGISIAEAERLLNLQQTGQVFALMLNQRTDPLFTTMREYIEAGTIGDITRTHWTMTNWFRPEVYFQVSDWRATWKGEGGGLLLNQCIHNLDIYQWLCGMPLSLRAFCQFGRYHEIEVEDEAVALFQYANGASGVFMGSTGEAPGVNQFDIVGDKGALFFDGKQLILTQNQPATSEYSRSTRDMFGMPASSTTDITPDRSINQHAAVLSNFADAVLTGEPAIAPACEGINSLALANAMLLSTWQSREVTFPLDSDTYQRALEARLAQSSFRKKVDIDVDIDMSASYR